jgi:hypothetical protein
MGTAIRTTCAALLAVLVAASAGAQTAQDLPVSARQAADFRALRERPLFAPDRRAPMPMGIVEEPVAEVVPEPLPEPPPPAATAPDWILVGLVRSDRVKSAMFRTSGEKHEFSLRTGESRDGWTLTEVGRSEAILDSGSGRASIRFPVPK